jgi:alkaline phosphatase D
LPAKGAAAARFRLAVAGCQRIEQGFFTGWADIAKSDVDLVFHYGDYIYEYALKEPEIAARMGRPVGRGVLPALSNLAQYRMRYALYKLDPDLAAAHAAHPFVVSFDDHEVSNDWGGADSGSVAMDEATFLKLRAAAFQAFYENTPVRPAQRPRGSDITGYRALEVGTLLRLAVLDTRQFRSPPACPRTANQRCDARLDSSRSMIGTDQERWLTNLFGRGDTTWTVLGNQVMMMQRQMRDPALNIVDTDKWDGNAAARRRLLQAAADRKVAGLVTVTGDVHRTYVGDLRVDFENPKAPAVGAEFVVSSISSVGDGKPEPEVGVRLLSANPHMRFYDWRRGYVICDFDERRCETNYRGIDYVSRKGSPVTTIASFTVEAKKPGLA